MDSYFKYCIHIIYELTSLEIPAVFFATIYKQKYFIKLYIYYVVFYLLQTVHYIYFA